MITCDSCGELVQVGQLNCQHCGVPLYSTNQEGAGLEKNTRGQSDLPTWLESLRVNERPKSAASEQSYVPMVELYEEGTLPGWMRSENAEMMEKGNSGPYPAWRPASMSAPHTDQSTIPQEGISARSLIDEHSLPSWVQGNQQNIHAIAGAMPVTPDSQGNFSAASLIQPDDLPVWIKSFQQPSQNSVSQNNVLGGEQPHANQVHRNSYPPDPANVNSNSLPQRFSAQDLADPQAMTHLISDQARQQSEYPLVSGNRNEHSGLSASSLLDENSLPAWLHEEDQKQTYASSQSGQAPAENYGLTGASLIDSNALPGWMTSYGTQQQSDIQSMGNVRPHSTNGTPPRVESGRVPSRPRGEIVSHEQSAIAANVFSSMLGVASSAPNFPSAESAPQWNTPSQNVFAPSEGSQAGQPEPPARSQWNVPSQPSGFAGASPLQGYNPAGNQVGQHGVNPAGAYAGYTGSGDPSMGALSGMPQQPPASGPSMPEEPSMIRNHSDTNAVVTKPAKRGFIETIRSWFS